MRKELLAILVAMLLLPSRSGRCWAEELPDFELETCVLNATEIFVAEQHAHQVRVLESWLGDLKPGAIIAVSDLPTKPMTVATRPRDNGPRQTVNFQRVVLFLKHPDGALPDNWTGAGAGRTGETRFSAVWIENDAPFAFQQFRNPGPVEMRSLYLDEQRKPTEENLKQIVLGIKAADAALARAMAIENLAERLAALDRLARQPYRHQWHRPVHALAMLGPKGTGALRGLLHDCGPNCAEVCQSLVWAAGDDAGAQITEIVGEELAFWKRVAPELPVGWRDNLKGGGERYAARAEMLEVVLSYLAETRYEPARKTVKELRGFWAASPQLNWEAGPQVPARCDSVLKTLDQKSNRAERPADTQQAE